MLRISSRNARFQQWEALLGNRGKRQRAGEFLVQGVRPITLAARFGWPFRALLYDADRALSGWARDLLRDVPAVQVAMAPDLLAELGEKGEGPPELLAVVEMPNDDLHRIPAGPSFLGVVLDRPASPGNVGSIIRSADAFGADGIIVTGHAADVYDPRTIRASTGSLFARPVVRCPSHREVLRLGRGPALSRLPRHPGRRRRTRPGRRLRPRLHPAHPAPGRQRDRRPDRRLAHRMRRHRPHPHHRRRQLPQRRQRRHRHPLRNHPPAPPGPSLASVVQRARLVRMVSVSGCSAPRTRSDTGSSAAYWSRAAAASPACPVQRARLARAVSVSGCSAPRTRSRTGSSAAYWSRAAAGSPASPVQ